MFLEVIQLMSLKVMAFVQLLMNCKDWPPKKDGLIQLIWIMALERLLWSRISESFAEVSHREIKRKQFSVEQSLPPQLYLVWVHLQPLQNSALRSLKSKLLRQLYCHQQALYSTTKSLRMRSLKNKVAILGIRNQTVYKLEVCNRQRNRNNNRRKRMS